MLNNAVLISVSLEILKERTEKRGHSRDIVEIWQIFFSYTVVYLFSSLDDKNELEFIPIINIAPLKPKLSKQPQKPFRGYREH